jgi:acyl-[acyl-carrier-protein]-phospholipid O-acyltransferase/long-chain-fatty-acid--[acyl-carrier-protein] ligase
VPPKIVSRICYDLAATVLFSDALTYKECVTGATSFDFFNMKLAFSVGKKADNETLDYWLKNFNVRIFESYIPSDSAFVATINTPLYYKFGSLGSRLFDKKSELTDLEFDEAGFAFIKQ